jgi:hypothetical protein
VPVITFTSLIVISQDTLAANNISETIFERMFRWRDRLRDSPYSHLCECIESKDNATANERDSLHVGDYDNTLELLSMSPTNFTDPARQNVEVTGAARLYRAASSDRRERGRPPG